MEKDESMSSFFKNKVIYIFSPQPWDYLQISKHHYARALAKDNEVYFVPPPANAILSNFTIENERKGLYVVRYTIPSPWFLRAKFPAFYKFLLRYFLSRLLRKNIPKADIVFDFGCYRLFDSLDFVSASHKIFFPVDDFGTLQPDERGSDIVLTVSEYIQRKFPEGKCHFINHGLAEEFSKKVNTNTTSWHQRGTVKVGCSGNLFIRFLDTETLGALVSRHPTIEFHFFGSQEATLSVDWQRRWFELLHSKPNVRLRGMLSAQALADAYDDMDIFLLCYKPDYINYHAENSHKVLEYLCAGKVLVSSYLSIYSDTDLFQIAPKDNNHLLLSMFDDVIALLPFYNSGILTTRRREFALRHTYERNILKIGNLIEK